MSISLQRFARSSGRALAQSFLFRRGRTLFERNSAQWHLPMTKFDKLLCGGYLILNDFAEGLFPPRHTDQKAVYAGEVNCYQNLPGIDIETEKLGQMRKPFYGSAAVAKYFPSLIRILAILESLALRSNARLLELGCGCGWMAELLALSGYSVLGTTLAPQDVELANRRVAAMAAKGLDRQLEFKEAPMETLHNFVERESFDAAYVFEALHHAYDWRATIQAVFHCLKPNGWFLIANEPNLLHTFISYRVARLSNTHEIGLSKRQLAGQLHASGFRTVRVLGPRFNNLVSPLWIVAQKPR
jgi:2-polyprenyl-3-methyl-5-hydroxy-6-metoxy-1,4-benzoquinol methylase